ncbi:MAG: class I SAM-dependent methyltransferase [Actinomycetota bacterium]|nr:class I SAM-dependent methyltransferase [Actinomycetota bacterium]
MSTEDLHEQLRRAVAERRQSGLMGEEIEAGLDGRPELRAQPHPGAALASLRNELETLRHRSYLDPTKITTASHLPGGSAVHRTIGRAVSRQTEGTMQQVHDFAEQAIVALEGILDVLDDHLARAHEDLNRHIDEILIRLARFERPSAGPDVDRAHLRRRVEELEAAEAGRRFKPWYRNHDFEDRFRGSRDDLLERYADIADRLIGCDPVLDVGFGRGEILELLAARGVEARGVEIDPALVADAQDRGFDASVGEGLGTLAALPDGALGGIVLIQVVEHLSAQRLLELVALAFDKLRAGGRLVMETVNPQSLSVFANSFYIDPTHERPVHPAYLEFLCRQIGFATVELDWRSWPADSDRLTPAHGEPDAADNIDKLNQVLFGPGDYAVIAAR